MSIYLSFQRLPAPVLHLSRAKSLLFLLFDRHDEKNVQGGCLTFLTVTPASLPSPSLHLGVQDYTNEAIKRTNPDNLQINEISYNRRCREFEEPAHEEGRLLSVVVQNDARRQGEQNQLDKIVFAQLESEQELLVETVKRVSEAIESQFCAAIGPFEQEGQTSDPHMESHGET